MATTLKPFETTPTLMLGFIGWVIQYAPRHVCFDATSFHDYVEMWLKTVPGWVVHREWAVEDVGDGTSGRIDLYISAPIPCAIELDWVRPRGKSIMKLLQFQEPTLRVMGLRWAYRPDITPVAGIHTFARSRGNG
jgi:hypothetical protein